MNHLFKLKRDDKTVGYLRLKDGWTQFHSITFAKDQWYYPCDFKWKTAHPFVTKEKNGKDVFEGDKVSRIDDDELRYEVVYHPETCQWFIENNEDAFDIEVGLSENCGYIELINENNK